MSSGKHVAHTLSVDKWITDEMKRGMHFELESHLKEITIFLGIKVEFIFLEL